MANKFPCGWDEEHVRGIIEYYDSLADDKWMAEDEASFEDESHTAMMIPNHLVPDVRALVSESPNPAPTSPAS